MRRVLQRHLKHAKRPPPLPANCASIIMMSVSPANIFAKELPASPAAFYLHSPGQLLIGCLHSTCSSYFPRPTRGILAWRMNELSTKYGGVQPALALCKHAKTTNPLLLLLLSFVASSLWANLQILHASNQRPSAIFNLYFIQQSSSTRFRYPITCRKSTSVQPCTSHEAHCPCTPPPPPPQKGWRACHAVSNARF